MRSIDIGKTGLQGSALLLGMMRIVDLSRQQVDTLVQTALDAGIDFFDHADVYANGFSETKFGELLQERPSLRSKILIQSKCGIRPGMFDWSKDHILNSVDDILDRLKTDYLDILLLHRPDALMEPEEVACAFDRLAASGKVREFGVSNCNPGQISLLEKFLGRRIIVNQLQFSAAFTSMIDSGINVNMHIDKSINRDGGILDFCRLHDITIQAWSPLQYGFIEGNFLNSPKYEKLNEVLNRQAQEKNVTPGAIAIAWILRHPAKMQTVLGTTKPTRVMELSKAANVEMSRQEWYEIYLAAGNTLP